MPATFMTRQKLKVKTTDQNMKTDCAPYKC